MKRLLLVLVALILLTSLPQGQSQETEGFLSRFLAEGNPQLHTYRDHREVEAEAVRYGLKAQMEVETTLVGEKISYCVIREEGSGLVRDKIRQALEMERNAFGNGKDTEFTGNNYLFRVLEESEEETPKLGIKPRTKREFLIDGTLFFNTLGEVVRSEGKLIKSPSRFLRDVRVVIDYKQIAGVRMPVKLESRAKSPLGLFGEFTMKVNYHYLGVNDVLLSEETTDARQYP